MKPTVSFRAKTWIYTAAFLITGFLGLFGLVMGALFGTRTLTDANGDPRPLAAIPLLSVGLFLSAAAAMNLYQIIARRIPIISCYRDAVVCNIVGGSTIPGFRYLPRIVRMVLAIVTGHGFRRIEYWISWERLSGVRVRGMPMNYEIILLGPFQTVKTNETQGSLSLRQVEFRDSPQQIANTLNSLLENPTARNQLASWQSAR
jgi:hypothetical protein